MIITVLALLALLLSLVVLVTGEGKNFLAWAVVFLALALAIQSGALYVLKGV